MPCWVAHSQLVGQGCHGQWKVREKTKVFQGQGKVSKLCIWSGKFEILHKVGNLYHFGYCEHQVTRTTKGNWGGKHIEHVDKKLINMPCLRSVKFCSRSGKSQGIFFILMCGNPVGVPTVRLPFIDSLLLQGFEIGQCDVRQWWTHQDCWLWNV